MLQAFNCRNCGSALVAAGDFLACQYCGSQHQDDDPPVAQLVVDPLQEELACLDQEWQQEQEHYLWQWGDGTRRPPTLLGVAGGGLAYGLFMALYNVGAWAAAADMGANSQPPPAVPWAPYLGLPLLGAIFTFVGFCAIRQHWRDAWCYRQALRRYGQRRAAIVAAYSTRTVPLAIPVVRRTYPIPSALLVR